MNPNHFLAVAIDYLALAPRLDVSHIADLSSGQNRVRPRRPAALLRPAIHALETAPRIDTDDEGRDRPPRQFGPGSADAPNRKHQHDRHGQTGCEEHAGKYFVQDRLSLMSVSRSRESVSRYPARSMTRA